MTNLNLVDMIAAKISDRPVRFSGTPILADVGRVIFPYRHNWHGDYECEDVRIDKRTAGYRERLIVKPVIPPPIPPPFGLPGECCFETGPNTTYPCYDRPCGQIGGNCICRYGSR